MATFSINFLRIFGPFLDYHKQYAHLDKQSKEKSANIISNKFAQKNELPNCDLDNSLAKVVNC